MQEILDWSEERLKSTGKLSDEEVILQRVSGNFKGKEFYCSGYSVVAFKNRMTSFKDFYYITESTLIEKSIFDELIILCPIDISNRYLDEMTNINNPHVTFLASDRGSNDEDFKAFMDDVNKNYYENSKDYKIETNPEKRCKYRIVATSNYSRDDFTEFTIADNMKLDIAVKVLQTLEKHYGEDSEIFPNIKPVTYKPFIWVP